MGSRPSSASYLIPAVPHDGARSSEPSPFPCGQHTSLPGASTQPPAAESRAEPGCAVSIQLQPSLCSQSKDGIQTHNGHLPGRHSALSQGVATADPPRALHGPLAQQSGPEPTSVLNRSPATDLPSLHEPAASPAASPDIGPSVSRPHPDRHQWLHLPTQQGSVTSWPQNGSQLMHKWDHGSSGSQDFAQAKLAFTPAFPFSKQPCAVIW